MSRKTCFGSGSWMVWMVAMTAAWSAGAAAVAQGAAIFVKADASGANNGTSWVNAFRQVQPALNAAASGDEVWVAAGTYVENLTLKLGVALYGGFAGNETDLAQRNCAANPAILDGNQAGSVVTSPPGATETTRIDGFTIRNGTGTPSGSSSQCGGGIYCSSSSPMIANNTIIGNNAYNGGGIYCTSSSSPTVLYNTITRNSASTYGAGISCVSSSPRIANNTITGNEAHDGGGAAIYCNSSFPMIANNVITRNVASFGGTIRCDISSPIIANNTIAGNASGAIYNSSSSPTIANTIIAFNSSGIYHTGTGTPSLRCNCVYGNTVYNYSGMTDPAGTNGNISVDPRFASFPYGNMHIQPESPCVDAGNDGAVPPGWPDMDGQARIQGPHVDIGADESDGTVWPEGPYLIVRVSPDGDDAADGSSWALAKQTVQAGIDAASALGGEVWVKVGAYPKPITLRPLAHVYGGFDGTEEMRGQRDFRTNVTILDGQQGWSVVTVQGVGTLSGFTIRNGTYGVFCTDSSSVTVANNTITANGNGGIYCANFSSPTITDNMIMGNSAPSEGGGGIYCSTSSSPTITNNTITGNNGSGVYCRDSSPAIANTIVAFNSSGICVTGGGTPTLRNNCVFGNQAFNYAGATNPTGTSGNISADPQLAELAFGNVHIQPQSPCKDAGDNTVVNGGWLDIDGQARTQGSHVDIGADESDGTVWVKGPYVIIRVGPDGDDANDGASWPSAKRTVQAGIDTASAMGGEVWVEAGTYPERITLRPFTHVYGGFNQTEDTREQRDFRSNVTILDGQQGGSVVTARQVGYAVSTVDGFTIRNGKADLGGGIDCYASSSVIANNTITDNSGDGLCCCYSSSTITNNTIIGNSRGIRCSGYSAPVIVNSTIVGNADGGIDCLSSSPTITNTIVAFNASGIYAYLATPTLRHNCVYANAAYDYSGITDPTGTNGNVSIDPRIAGWKYGRWHIQPDSPCADAGDDNSVQPGWLDLDGHQRIQGLHVDIGADESDRTEWPEGPYAIVRVSPDGDDANDGSAWIRAKRTVQAGIDATALPGGEVWVKAGTYPERITLHPFAHVYGGFSGVEDARDQRDFQFSVTILDGQQDGSVVVFQRGYRVSTIDGFTITNGLATDGGGIYCYGSSPTIANNTIMGNTASCGGGIYCSSSSPTISNNTINGNRATGTKSWMGGGGIFCSSGSSPTITNNAFSGNTAGSSGGAILCVVSSPTIANNMITANIASYRGGGIYCSSSSATIANNVVSENRASIDGGAIYCYAQSPRSVLITNTVIVFNSSGVFRTGLATLSLRHNCTFGNSAYNFFGVIDPTGTSGNISADPLFARAASPGPDGQWNTSDDDYGNLRLQPASPCIDAGDNTAVPVDTADLDGDGSTTEPIPLDIAGNPRFADDPLVTDTGLGTPPIVDMGTYEHVPTAPADFDNDGDVDGDDLSAFAACGSGPGVPAPTACRAKDLDRDGDVDQTDFGLFQRCLSGPDTLADPACAN